jgi:glycerophosphoryl diester phosphodiesterase
MAGKFEVAQQQAEEAEAQETERRAAARRRAREQKERSIALYSGASSQSVPQHPEEEDDDEEDNDEDEERRQRMDAAPIMTTTMAAREAAKAGEAHEDNRMHNLEHAVDKEYDRRRRWRRMQRVRGAKRRARETEEWTQRKEELLDAKSQAAAAPTCATSNGEGSIASGTASVVGSGAAELVQFCCRRTADGVWVVCGPEQLHELVVAKAEVPDEFAPSCTTAKEALFLGAHVRAVGPRPQPLIDVVPGLEVEDLTLEELQSTHLRFPLRFSRGTNGRICKEHDADAKDHVRVSVSAHGSTMVSADAGKKDIDDEADLQQRVSQLPTLHETLATVFTHAKSDTSAENGTDGDIVFTDATGNDSGDIVFTDATGNDEVVFTNATPTAAEPVLKPHRQGVYLDLYLSDTDEAGGVDWWKEGTEQGWGEDEDERLRVRRRKGAAVDLVIAVEGRGDALERAHQGTAGNRAAHSKGVPPRVYVSSNSPALLREIRQLAPDWVLLYRVEDAAAGTMSASPGNGMALSKAKAVAVAQSNYDGAYDAYEGLTLPSAIPCLNFQQWQALQRNQQHRQQRQLEDDDPYLAESEAGLVSSALRSLTRWLTSVVSFADGVCIDKSVLLSPTTAVSVGREALDLTLPSRFTAAMGTSPLKDAAAAVERARAAKGGTVSAGGKGGSDDFADDEESDDKSILTRARGACPQWLVDCIRVAGLATFVQGLGEPTVAAAPPTNSSITTLLATPRPTISTATNATAATAAAARAAVAQLDNIHSKPLQSSYPSRHWESTQGTAPTGVWAEMVDLFSRCPRAEYELLLSLGVDAVVSERPGHALAARLRVWEAEAETVIVNVGAQMCQQRQGERDARVKAREERKAEQARLEDEKAKVEARERVRNRNTSTGFGTMGTTPRPTPASALNATAASAAAAAAAAVVVLTAAATLGEEGGQGRGTLRSKTSVPPTAKPAKTMTSAGATAPIQRRPQQPHRQYKAKSPSARTHLRKLRKMSGTIVSATTTGGDVSPEAGPAGLVLGGTYEDPTQNANKKIATDWRGREREQMTTGQRKRCFLELPFASTNQQSGTVSTAVVPGIGRRAATATAQLSAARVPTLPRYSRPHTHSSRSRHTRHRTTTSGADTGNAGTVGTYQLEGSNTALTASTEDNMRTRAKVILPRPHSYAARRLPAVGVSGGTKTVLMAQRRIEPSNAFLGYWGSGRRTDTYVSGVQRVKGYSTEHAGRDELRRDI